MQIYKEEINYDQTVKLYILSKKYSLTLKLIQNNNFKYTVDHSIYAIQNDAMDISTYLFIKNSDTFVTELQRIIKAHVDSFTRSN